MALAELNDLVKKAIGYLPDRGESVVLETDNLPIEFGRIIVERTADGKIRLKIGDGTNKFADLNYTGESIIQKEEPTTIAVGGVAAGTTWNKKAIDELIYQMLWQYQEADLVSFSHTHPDVELGQPLNSSFNINCNVANAGNLADGNCGFVSSSPQIFTGQAFDPRSTYTVTGVSGSFPTITDIVITVQITGKNGEISSYNRTIQVSPYIYTGSSSLLQIPDYATLKSIGSGRLARTRQYTHSFVNNYSHFGLPNLINLAGIGFIDVDINTNVDLLPMDVTPMPDLTIVNTYNVSITYKMWRSTNSFGGATKTRIS